MSLISLKENPIYKVNHLRNAETISSIHVFYGKNLEVDDMNELFKRDPRNPAFFNKNTNSPIFNEEELENIISKQIPVFFSDQQIHYDDNIGVAKLKIMMDFSNAFSLDEMYLFCIKDEILNPANIYQTLTQNGRLPLTKVRFYQFILNIIYDDKQEPVKFDIPNKEIYDYDDILALNLTGKKFSLAKVLGQKFFVVTNEYPFIVNPFEVDEYDDFIERSFRKSLTTLNSHLLLNTGDIVGNNIFLCTATDVFADSARKDISDKYTTKIYYPFLWEKNISSLDELESQKEILRANSEKFVNENALETFESVDLFYDIYKEKTSNLDYRKIGIKKINVTLLPLYNMNIPLDIIFKLIHATESTPLIKYNPGQRQENIYRLFADKIAKDGRKIPYLSRANILKLMKTIGKSKTVSVYIQYKWRDTMLFFICEFEENGDINISSDFEAIFPMEDIDEVLRKAVNPIISEVKNYLEQSGYTVQLFDNLKNDNVRVDKIDYETVVHIERPIKIDDFMGCLSSIFIVESKNFTKGIQMRFKRVSNFNKMNSQEAFVIEQVKNRDGLKGIELIRALMENYSISEREAENIIAKLASELQVERGVRKSDIEIKINPGFKTLIALNSITSQITVRVENINDINYLYTIPIYLDSFVRLTQNKSSTRVPTDRINLLCGSDEKDEIVIDDIVSATETAFLNQEMPVIEGDSVSFVDFNEYMESPQDKGEKQKTALDLFFADDDDDDDASDEQHGGESSTPENSSQASSSSLSSLNISEGDIQGLDALESVPLPGPRPETEMEEQSNEEQSNEEQSDASLSSFESTSDKSPAVTMNVEEVVAPEPSPKSEKMAEYESDDELVVPEHALEVKPVPKKLEKKTSVKFDLVEPERISKPEANLVRNIDGMKLSTPNPFQTRMEELDPILFNNPKQNGKFNSYSRSCLHSARKQPVILTEEEMNKIDEEQPGFLKRGQENGDILRYGSNPDNQFYYMCPRYWCMKTNKPISEEDVKSGKCGKVIPRNATVIKPGEYVFEFYDKSEHGTQENYIKHYPGFLESEKHPDGLCMPCCFKNWNTKVLMGRRQQCAQNIAAKKLEEQSKKRAEQKTEENVEEPTTRQREKAEEPAGQAQEQEQDQEEKSEELAEKGKRKITEKEDYIKGPEKYPLGPGRWGYLPMSIQKFLHEVNADCQISKTNTNIKPFHTCLLRHGVEINRLQSFIACISDAKFYGDRQVLSVKEMKELIIKAITLDSYVIYQNGDLISIFMNKEPMEATGLISKKYTASKIYSKINKRNEKEMLYFQNIVRSFENFILFLRNDEITIDYTYLWDIICKPNPKIFPQGINLVILEIANNDTTNNVELICPTNHYSSEFYEARKQTLILLKNEEYYEPLYTYRVEGNKTKVNKTFSEYDPHISKTMKAIFKKLIKPILKNTCFPLASMPKVYSFKTPILLERLIELLNKYNYDIENQIVNYQGKVISVVCKNPREVTGVVPCFPSSINETYNYVFMSDETMYSSYKNTIRFLTILSAESKRNIPCLPEFKVVEDEMIVGIITETNQFIQLNDPFPISEAVDDIKIMNSNNYLIAENNTLLSDEVDTERVEYIKKIRLETNFYNVFRNTIRILLNKYENIKLREKIEDNVKNGYMLYGNKLLAIIKNLKDLVKKSIIFSDEYNYSLIGEISTCVVLEQDKCNGKRPLCAFSTGNTCQLILPKYNLITGLDNEVHYFGKMSDELIRYSRINSFIFQPKTYLSFGNVSYNLKEDEILILQSLLNGDYFEGLIPAEINKFAKFNTYDTTEPILSQTYENRTDMNEAINPKNMEHEHRPGPGPEPGYAYANDGERECIPKSTNKISSMLWKPCFPPHFDELMYDKTVYCGFYMIIDIIKRAKGIELSVSQLKTELLKEYVKYLVNYEEQVIDILIEEGKKTLGDQVKAGTLSFQNFIYTDSYFITNFDIWIMVEKYNIPSILISSKTLLETKHKKSEFVMHGTPRSDFVFIVAPGLRSENIPKYKIIQSPEKEIFFPMTIINEGKCRTSLDDAIEKKITIEEYLSSFVKTKTTRYVLKNPNPKPAIKLKSNAKPQKIKLVLQEDEDDTKINEAVDEAVKEAVSETHKTGKREEVFIEIRPESGIEQKPEQEEPSKKKTLKNKGRVELVNKTKRKRKHKLHQVVDVLDVNVVLN